MATKKRELWDVWRDGAVWMVQGPRARVHFNSKKVALDVAARNKALAADAAAVATGAKPDTDLSWLPEGGAGFDRRIDRMKGGR
jgi:hypothetical protein